MNEQSRLLEQLVSLLSRAIERECMINSVAQARTIFSNAAIGAIIVDPPQRRAHRRALRHP